MLVRKSIILLITVLLCGAGVPLILKHLGYTLPYPGEPIKLNIKTEKDFEVRVKLENMTVIVLEVRRKTCSERELNIIELEPKDYNYSIIKVNGLIQVIGKVMLDSLTPNEWYYIRVRIPVKFEKKPCVILTGALKYGELGHLEKPGEESGIPIDYDHFWCAFYSTSSGKIAFTFISLGFEVQER